LCEPSPQRVGLHEVRECPLAVDLDDRQPLSVAALELGVAGDVDLLELERDLRSDRLEDAARCRAQVAVASVVEDDPGDG
jgi:hypothetical protein